ncbi:MAG TPA: amino acid permease [Planctomycetaceae bacterium]|nr:amino acid permease [Planctomycetaceae bacterium]
MNSNSQPEPATGTLRRDVGIFGATMMGLGAIVGTGIFVSIGHAAGVAGDWIVIAIGIAAVVATLNGLSSAQLAAAHPVSGGTYEYGYRWLHPSLGFTAGWMFLCAKSASAATAALGFAGYGLRLFGIESTNMQIPIGLGALLVVLGFILRGIRWSSIFNATVVSLTLTSLVLFVVAGVVTILHAPANEPIAIGSRATLPSTSLSGVLEACALMFVAYTGYGRIATLGEEIRDPSRNIPIAIIVTLGISMALYVSIAWVSIGVVGAEAFSAAAESEAAPLEMVARNFDFPAMRYVIAVGAITSMLGVLINLVLGLSRVVLAMGRRGDMPHAVGRIDPSGVSPRNAVIVVGTLIAVLILTGNVKTTWSFSAFTVLIYYAITNLAALQMSDAERRYPRAIAWLGLLSCLFLAFWVDRAVWLVGLSLIAAGLVWWRYGKQLLAH